MPGSDVTVIYEPDRRDVRRSWNPGVATPLFLLTAVAVAVFDLPIPRVYLLLLVLFALVGWLARPLGFCVFGRAPRIEVAGAELRVVQQRRTQNARLVDLERADLTRGGWDGHVFTKSQAWPRVEFVWRPGAAPGVDGFPPAVSFGASLPVLGRRRIVVLREIAQKLAAQGLPSVLSDLDPIERVDPSRAEQ